MSLDHVRSHDSASTVEKYDDDKEGKLDAIELGRLYNFDEEFAKIEQQYQDSLNSGSSFEKFASFELVKLNFKNKTHMVWFLGFFASIAGILSGADQSLISGTSLSLPIDLNLSAHQSSLVSSLMPLGAVLGSILMTPLSEFFGRKFSLVVSCIAYTIGGIACAAALNHEVLYFGRFFVGIGIGIEGASVGVYISECVPANVRGNLVSLYQFNIAFGEVLGYAIAAIFLEVKGAWRYMLGSSLVFSTILLCGLFFLPESPRYLVHKNRVGEAWGVWKRLRDIDDDRSKVEFLEMRHAARQEAEESARESRFTVWMDIFRIPRCRRALVYSVIMIALGQLTGVNGIMYYMSTLMQNIGFSPKNSIFMSLVGGGALFLGTIPSILYMDKFGRRTWAQNLVGFFFGLVLVGIGYRINIKTHLAAAEGVYLTGLILYMGFFGSYASLTWVVPSESFDLRTRSIGMTISSSFLYMWSFIITYNFTSMQNAMTNTGLALGFFGGIGFIGFWYQILFMPETKNKTLEEIDDIFSQPTSAIVKQNIKNLKKFWRIGNK